MYWRGRPGHRKIWALTVADGHEVGMRTVHRILGDRGLLNGRRYQAERCELAQARRTLTPTAPCAHRIAQTLTSTEEESQR